MRPVKTGDWVRYRRHPYKDDLAEVIQVAESGTKVVVRMFPRLDLAASKAAAAAGAGRKGTTARFRITRSHATRGGLQAISGS